MARVRRKRTWLIPFTRHVLAHEADHQVGAPIADAAELDGRLKQALDVRGFAAGFPLDVLKTLGEFSDEASYDEYAFLNTLAHRMLLSARVARREGAVPDDSRGLLLLFAVCAEFVGDVESAQAAHRLLDTEDLDLSRRGTAREVNRLAKTLGAALADRAVEADDPLLGHPFHQILSYQDTLLFGRLAWLVARGRAALGGRPDRHRVLEAHGAAQTARFQAISASVALTCADGKIDEDERRLIHALVEAARLDETGEAAIEAEFERPPAVTDLAEDITDPLQRRSVLRLIYLAAHVDGHFAGPERRFVERLAAAFGVPGDDLARYEAEAVANFQQHARLVEALSTTNVLRRMRAHLTDRVEDVVRDNAGRLWAEIRETSELAELLVKSGSAELTEAERQQVREQITDICRAIPALAIFAVPGGSILLPIVLKHLPFNLLPSNFNDDEVL